MQITTRNNGKKKSPEFSALRSQLQQSNGQRQVDTIEVYFFLAFWLNQSCHTVAYSLPFMTGYAPQEVVRPQKPFLHLELRRMPR